MGTGGTGLMGRAASTGGSRAGSLLLLGRFPWIAILDIVRHVGVQVVKGLGPHNVEDGTSRPWAVLLIALPIRNTTPPRRILHCERIAT